MSFFFNPAAKLVVNLIPDDARLLRQMFKQNAENSQKTGWCALPTSVVIPRLIVAPMTVPVSLVTGVSYGICGLSRCVFEVMHLNFEEAFDAFLEGTLKGFQCAALGVACAAYATLGLAFGAMVFKKFVPNPVIIRDISDELDNANEALSAVNKALKQANDRIRLLEIELANSKKGKKEDDKETVNATLEYALECDREAELAGQSEREALLLIKLDNKKAKLENARGAEEANQRKIAGLETDLERAEQKNRELEANQGTGSKEDEIPSQRMADKRKKIERLRSIIKQKEEESKELTLKLKELYNYLSLLEAGILNAEEKQAKQQLMKASLQAQIPKQSLRLEQMQQLLQKANEELAQLRKQMDDEKRSPGEEGEGMHNSMLSSLGWDELQDPGPIPTGGLQQPPLSFLQMGQGMIVGTLTKAAEVATGVYNKVCEFLIDGKESWKEMRYAVAINQLLKVVGQAEFDKIYKALNKESAKNIASPLQCAIATLLLPEGTLNPRTQFQNFQKSWREGLRLLQSNPDQINPELRKRIDAINYHWFTSLQMVTFFFELVTYVASKGDAKIIDALGLDGGPSTEPLLSKKLRLLLDGIKNASKEYTAPIADTTFEKAGTIQPSFDPMHKNMPNLTCEMTYEIKECEPRKIRHVRTGVPIGPKVGEIKDVQQAWEIEKISLIPEYLSYLRSLKDRGEKLMTFLHLNPKYYNQQTGKLEEPPSMFSLHEVQKYREALWIKLIVDLSKDDDFENILSVALFPMDGDWFEGVQSEEEVPKKHFIEELVEAFADEKGSFIIPGMDANQKREFAKEIADRVSKEYFYPLNEEAELDKDQKLAFYGFFFSLAKEELYLRDDAITIVEDRCKDGVDRTEALVGAELVEKLSRLGRTPEKPIGRLEDRETQDQIIGTTLGPALGILKRAILENRVDLLKATAKHMEWLSTHEVAREDYDPYTVGGFKLVDVVMGGDETQTLYPAPSKAKNEEDYLKLLRFEAEHPFTLPASRKLPASYIHKSISGKMIKRGEDLNAILDENLPSYRVFIGREEYFPVNDSVAASTQFVSALSEKLPLDLRHHALMAATPYIWNAPYEMLKNRYENDLYRIISPQDRWVGNPVGTYRLYKSEPTESHPKGKDMLAIEHSFPICRKDDCNTVVAYAKVLMSIDLEDPDSRFEYSYKIITDLEEGESGSDDDSRGAQSSKEAITGKGKEKEERSEDRALEFSRDGITVHG